MSGFIPGSSEMPESTFQATLWVTGLLSYFMILIHQHFDCFLARKDKNKDAAVVHFYITRESKKLTLFFILACVTSNLQFQLFKCQVFEKKLMLTLM